MLEMPPLRVPKLSNIAVKTYGTSLKSCPSLCWQAC
ncbi:hypothetical protein [Methanosarcina mazei]|nr:hypothetical protein [Methanosarcina mazei]